jgi:quinoprotein glucose dehydrogenase
MFKPNTVSALVWAISMVLLVAIRAPAAEIIPSGPNTAPHVAPASDEGERAIKRFRVPKGFKVELFAAEPLLANPVCFSIDEKGRFYVAETFRLHDGVTDIRGHMNWLDDDLACKSVEDRVAMLKKFEGKNITNYARLSDRVRLLEDTDGDGRADKSTVFADGFNNLPDGIGAGLLARKGNVYYSDIPNLWLLRDITGRGVANVKKSLSYGYGVRVGFIGHDLHGLRFGPDGKLYFSIGDRGAHVRTKEGATIENHETGAVYRCDPDGSGLEIYASGLRNPQELVFDQYGNLWTGDNNSDAGDPARWVYVAEGGDSGWRIGFQFIEKPNARGPWLSERLCYPQWDGQASFIVPPIAIIANGPAGLAYNPGTGLPDRYREHFFLCDFRGASGSGVHSFAVKPKGASFEMVDRSEFIWEVLVTDGDFGYDGCFYISDWVNGWEKTGKGRIYRVYDPESVKQPIVAETKRLFAEGFDQRSLPQLAGLLTHPDLRVRQEAQFALADKAAVPTLAQIADGNESRLARLHAIWGLGQIANRRAPASNPNAEAALLPLLADADAEARAQAAKVLGDGRSTKAFAGLLKLLADPSPRPRFFAAIALGKLGRKEAVPALVEMLRANDNQDRYLRHAGVMGLLGCADVAALHNLAKDPSAGARMAAVVAMRRLRRPEIAAFLRDTDAAIVREAARAISDEPIAGALPQLAALAPRASQQARQQENNAKSMAATADKKSPAELPDLVSPLLRRIINANFRLGSAANAAALAALSANSDLPEAMRVEALSALGDWAKPSGRDRVTGLWRPLLSRDASLAAAALNPVLAELLRSPSTPVKLAAIKGAAKLGSKAASATAFDLVANPRESASVRVEALKSLAAFNDARLADAVKLAAADRDESLRREATRIEAQLRPSDAAAKLKDVLEKGTVGEKQAALATLGTLPGTAADEILSQWLDKLMAKQVTPALQLDVIDAAAKRNASTVKQKLEKFQSARDPKDDMRDYRECLAGGNVEEGKKVFFERQEVACLRCHKINGEGGEVGPDLTGIGARKDREYILESIVYPNKQVAAGFESLLVTLKNGTAYAGVFKSETDAYLEINSPEDGLLKLKKADIKTRERGLSSMPEELRQVLTKQDLRNLVEYLSGLK